MSTETIPNPGSIEAVHKGCTCPVLDNAHGKGVHPGEADPLFWVNSSCPVHGPEGVDKW